MTMSGVVGRREVSGAPSTPPNSSLPRPSGAFVQHAAPRLPALPSQRGLVPPPALSSSRSRAAIGIRQVYGDSARTELTAWLCSESGCGAGHGGAPATAGIRDRATAGASPLLPEASAACQIVTDTQRGRPASCFDPIPASVSLG